MATANTDIFNLIEQEGKMFLNEEDLKTIKAIEELEEMDYNDDFLITEVFTFTSTEDY
jgi:hypothetical protein